VVGDRQVDRETAFLEAGSGGWDPWEFGRFWLLDTERGVLMVTAESQVQESDLLDETIAMAETVLATIEFVEIEEPPAGDGARS
jgi:hypothetical protein